MGASAMRIREPTKTELGRLMSLSNAALHLAVSERTIRRMIDRRQVAAVKIGHGRGVWRISEDEIRRIMAEGTVPPY
jgi:excisionase family DNA binding protein